jgi:tRNA pseudouridine55 synthase
MKPDTERILIIDKPAGMTSHDVVDVVRRRFGIKKVGHCGTLDPMATGVLVILTDKATKLSAELSSDDKEYICRLTLGTSTDTHDSTGSIIEKKQLNGITEQAI